MGWTYKLAYINAEYTYMNVTVEFTAPSGDAFSKTFHFETAKTLDEVKAYAEEQITKIIALQQSYETLSQLIDTPFVYTAPVPVVEPAP